MWPPSHPECSPFCGRNRVFLSFLAHGSHSPGCHADRGQHSRRSPHVHHSSPRATPRTDRGGRAGSEASHHPCALVATLGPFFCGFEGTVLNGAVSAVGRELESGALGQGPCLRRRDHRRLHRRHLRRSHLRPHGTPHRPDLGGLLPPLRGCSQRLQPLARRIHPLPLLCRIVGGIGFGAATAVVPSYVAQLRPRGKMSVARTDGDATHGRCGRCPRRDRGRGAWRLAPAASSPCRSSLTSWAGPS